MASHGAPLRISSVTIHATASLRCVSARLLIGLTTNREICYTEWARIVCTEQATIVCTPYRALCAGASGPGLRQPRECPRTRTYLQRTQPTIPASPGDGDQEREEHDIKLSCTVSWLWCRTNQCCRPSVIQFPSFSLRLVPYASAQTPALLRDTGVCRVRPMRGNAQPPLTPLTPLSSLPPAHRDRRCANQIVPAGPEAELKT